MSSEKKIKELEEKIAYYEGLPAAKFYTALVKGIEHLTMLIENKKLDFDADPYAKSLYQLSKDSDKIMIALGKGLLVINPQEIEPQKSGPTKKGKNEKALAV